MNRFVLWEVTKLERDQQRSLATVITCVLSWEIVALIISQGKVKDGDLYLCKLSHVSKLPY